MRGMPESYTRLNPLIFSNMMRVADLASSIAVEFGASTASLCPRGKQRCRLR